MEKYKIDYGENISYYIKLKIKVDKKYRMGDEEWKKIKVISLL